MKTTSLRAFFTLALGKASLWEGLKVALFVGVILNLINQGDRLLRMDVAHLDFPKLLLTFLVPFCVSVYAGTRTRMRLNPGSKAYRDALVICKSCGESKTSLKKGEVIPECPQCHEKTRWIAIRARK